MDHLDVGDRVDLSGDMDDVGVLEAAHDVGDRVGLADIREELVAETLALRCARDQSRDVDELHDRGDDLLRLVDRGELFQARVGYFDHADVGLDGAERIVLRGDARLGERVEERGLAHVGQPDDAALEAHGSFSSSDGGFGVVCSHVIASCKRPLARRGSRSRLRSKGGSMASCSSRRASCST